MTLFNIFKNKLNNLIDNSDEENNINYYQNRNTISFQLLTIRKDRVIGCFKLKKQIDSAKENIFDINFLYQRIIKCN